MIGCKILILETSRARDACRDQNRSCEAVDYVENMKSVLGHHMRRTGQRLRRG